MDDKDQNLRDEMNDIVAYLESDEEMRRKIRCAIKNKMKIKIVDWCHCKYYSLSCCWHLGRKASKRCK